MSWLNVNSVSTKTNKYFEIINDDQDNSIGICVKYTNKYIFTKNMQLTHHDWQQNGKGSLKLHTFMGHTARTKTHIDTTEKIAPLG